LSKQALNILEQITAVVFFGAMGITPLVILVLGIINYRRDSLRQAKSALQALGALGIWAGLTSAVFMIFIMTVFSYPAHNSHSNQVKVNVITTVGTLIYTLAGAALIYWTKRQTRRMPPMGFSC
jgi:phage-related holin